MSARCVSGNGNAIAAWGRVTLCGAHLCDAVVSIQNSGTVQRDNHMQATGDRRICFGSLRRHFGD